MSFSIAWSPSRSPACVTFRGIAGNGFDGRGNFAMGMKEQIVFPEIAYEKVTDIRGMDIIFVTSAKTDAEAKALAAWLRHSLRQDLTFEISRPSLAAP